MKRVPDSWGGVRSGPLRPRSCECARPVAYVAREEWGEERYCVKCGRELAGTGERRRLQQLALIAADPDARDLFDESAVERFEASAPAPADVRPGPDREAGERFPCRRSRPQSAAGAPVPTGRAVAPAGGPADSVSTIEGGLRATHHPVL